MSSSEVLQHLFVLLHLSEKLGGGELASEEGADSSLKFDPVGADVKELVEASPANFAELDFDLCFTGWIKQNT